MRSGSSIEATSARISGDSPEHDAVAGERLVDGFDRDAAADAKGRDGQRKHDGAAQRDDGKFAGDRGSLGSLNQRRNLFHDTRVTEVCHKKPEV